MIKKIFLVFLLVPLISFAQKTTKAPLELAYAFNPRLYGLENAKGNAVTQPIYTRIEDAGDNRWIAELGGKCGLLDSNGKWIVKPLYADIRQICDDKMVAGKRISRMDPEYVAENPDLEDYYDDRIDSIVAYGVVTINGEWLINPKYGFIMIGESDRYLVKNENGKFGYVNVKGEEVIAPQFEYATPFTGNVAIVSEGGYTDQRDYRYYDRYTLYTGGTWRIIGKNGEPVSTTEYDYIGPFENGRAPFNKGGRWRMHNYSDQRVLSGGMWGYIDENGTEIIPATYTYAFPFGNGVAKVRKDKDIVWIDVNGNTVVAPLMQATSTSMYCISARAGFIDKTGNWKILPSFHEAGRFSEGLAAVQPLLPHDNDCSYDQFNGYTSEYEIRRNINPFSHREMYQEFTAYEDLLENYNDSISRIRRFWGYTDINGKLVIDAKFDYALPFSNGRAYVCYRGKWGVINKKGEWILHPVMDAPYIVFDRAYELMHGKSNDFSDSPWYLSASDQEDELFSFHEGIGLVYFKSKYGYIDSTGKIISSPVYDDARAFRNGRGAVMHNSLWGFVDNTGKEVIELKYRLAGQFAGNGLARVGVEKETEQARNDDEYYSDYYSSYDYRYGYIDKNGKTVIEPTFQYAGDFHDDIAVVGTTSYLRGYIDSHGKKITSEQFRVAGDFKYGYAMVSMDYENNYFINKTGTEAKQYTTIKPPPYPETWRTATDESGRVGWKGNGDEWKIAPAYYSAGKFFPVN